MTDQEAKVTEEKPTVKNENNDSAKTTPKKDTEYPTKDRRLVLAMIAFGFKPVKVERVKNDAGRFLLKFTFDLEHKVKIDWEKIIDAIKAIGDEPSADDFVKAYRTGKCVPLPDVNRYAVAEEVWRTNLYQ